VAEVAALRKAAVIIGFMPAYCAPRPGPALKNAASPALRWNGAAISRRASMDRCPRSGRCAGYKAALIAANMLDGFCPCHTAAGTIKPASVLVIGAESPVTGYCHG